MTYRTPSPRLRAGVSSLFCWANLAGVAALVAPLAVFSFAAAAETRDISGSLVTLQPTDHPGAIAEVEFENNAVNGPADNSTFTLTLNGMEVRVEYTWNAEGGQNDRITVEPPGGFVAVPRTLDVTEHTTGVVHLFAAGPGS